MNGRLPPTPDFIAVEAAAPAFANRQNQVLAMIGNLIFSWSNNESMFVYVLMLLLETDDVCAAIVFSTLNTTRARLDLVRRLATVKLTDVALAQTLTRLMKRFDAVTRLRNEFNHCVYSLNERGEIVSTHLMRVHEDRAGMNLGRIRPMDESRLDELAEANRQLKRLNRDLWSFLPQLEAFMKAKRSAGSQDTATGTDPSR